MVFGTWDLYENRVLCTQRELYCHSAIPASVHPILISFIIPLILLIISTYLIWLILTNHHFLQIIMAPGVCIGTTIIRPTLGKGLYLSCVSMIQRLNYYTMDHQCYFSKLLFAHTSLTQMDCSPRKEYEQRLPIVRPWSSRPSSLCLAHLLSISMASSCTSGSDQNFYICTNNTIVILPLYSISSLPLRHSRSHRRPATSSSCLYWTSPSLSSCSHKQVP